MDEMAFYEDMLKRKRMLPQALGVQSPGGVLTQDVQPGASLPRSLSARKQIAELEAQQDDMSAIQAYARQQGEAGQSAMLNALAAQFAGESFQPVQAQFLKRAMAAQEPMRVGKGMITPDGQYIVDPSAKREGQIARLSREAEIADRLEASREAQAERLTAAKEAAQLRADTQRTLAEMRQAGGGSSPYYQPVQTAQGVYAFNSRTGRMEPIAGGDGKPIVGAQFDPTLQGTIAGAKAGGSAEGKLRAEAAFDAPKAIAQGKETIRLVDDLLASPGFKQAVGASRMLGIQSIPGTAAKDFDIRLDQLKGQQFLQAFETLKGGGQITEVEGKKATDAIARMNAAGSEAEFIKAANEFKSVIQQGIDRAQNNAQAQPAQRKRIRYDAQGNEIP